jgi:hypothetical protein
MRGRPSSSPRHERASELLADEVSIEHLIAAFAPRRHSLEFLADQLGERFAQQGAGRVGIAGESDRRDVSKKNTSLANRARDAFWISAIDRGGSRRASAPRKNRSCLRITISLIQQSIPSVGHQAALEIAASTAQSRRTPGRPDLHHNAERPLSHKRPFVRRL